MQDNFATDGTMQTDASQLTLRNSDFFIPGFNTVKCGRHSIRYLGPFLWSKLSKKGQGPSHIIGLQNEYSEERPFLAENRCSNCTCVILETLLVNLLLA